MKPFLLLFLLFNITSLKAQSYEDDLILGVGLIHYPSPNASGLAFYGEYSRPFFSKTMIGISAAAALPVEYTTSEEQQRLSSYHFSMDFYYKLIKMQKQLFKIGFGFSAGSYDTEWTVIDTGLTGTDHVFQPGLAILMEYNLIFSQRVILGVTAKGLLYGDDKSALFAGLHGGFRF